MNANIVDVKNIARSHMSDVLSRPWNSRIKENKRTGSARTFLCGYFEWPEKKESCLASWEKQNGYNSWCKEIDGRPNETKDYHYWCSMYYESYVESLLGKNAGAEGRDGMYANNSHWVKSINKSISAFEIKRLHLFRFPLGQCIFAIEILESDIDLNDMTTVHHKLREVSSYEDGLPASWGKDYLDAVSPLLEICPYTDWVEAGGKLKAFQIVASDYIGDDLLYEIGTMSKVGVVSDISEDQAIRNQ